MTVPSSDEAFTGSIAQLYQELTVPLIFEPYAVDLAERVASHSPARVLEIAAGTGVATRQLATALPDEAVVVATDLNPAMLKEAAAAGTPRPVQWRQADAADLPFRDGEFDAVVCQFGMMFPPDKAKAFSEARRVLRPGGVFVFSVWDRIEDNEVADVITEALVPLFPDDPPRFLARTPHGYHDLATVRRDLAAGGFDVEPQISTLTLRSRAASARVAAVALCQGSPLRNEIESRLQEATDLAEAALVARFGPGPVDGKMQAHVITVPK